MKAFVQILLCTRHRDVSSQHITDWMRALQLLFVNLEVHLDRRNTCTKKVLQCCGKPPAFTDRNSLVLLSLEYSACEKSLRALLKYCVIP